MNFDDLTLIEDILTRASKFRQRRTVLEAVYLISASAEAEFGVFGTEFFDMRVLHMGLLSVHQYYTQTQTMMPRLFSIASTNHNHACSPYLCAIEESAFLLDSFELGKYLERQVSSFGDICSSLTLCVAQRCVGTAFKQQLDSFDLILLDSFMKSCAEESRY